MINVTEDEAKELHCPLLRGHCKGKKCMMFNFAGNEMRLMHNLKKPLNVPEQAVCDIYYCGFNQAIVTLTTEETDDESDRYFTKA